MNFHGFPWHRLYVHLTTTSRDGRSSLSSVRAGVLWPFGHPGISTPESLRGNELPRILPSVLPSTYLYNRR